VEKRPIVGIGQTEFSKESGRSELPTRLRGGQKPRSPDAGMRAQRPSTGMVTFTNGRERGDRGRPPVVGIGDLTFFTRVPPRPVVLRRGPSCRAAMAVATGTANGRGVCYRAFNETLRLPVRWGGRRDRRARRPLWPRPRTPHSGC